MKIEIELPVQAVERLQKAADVAQMSLSRFTSGYAIKCMESDLRAKNSPKPFFEKIDEDINCAFDQP